MVRVYIWDPKDIWELGSGWGHVSIDIDGHYFSHWPSQEETSFLNMVFGGQASRISSLQEEKKRPEYTVVIRSMVEHRMIRTLRDSTAYSGPYANCSSVVAKSLYSGLHEHTLWNPFKIWTPLLVFDFASKIKSGYGMGVYGHIASKKV